MTGERQFFGSSLRQPWALVVFGSNAPYGKRPATSVAYLTDDEGEYYLGGLVEFRRDRSDVCSTWHFRYKNAKRIDKADVLHRFGSTNKGKFGGPHKTEIARARRALPVTMAPPAESVA